MASKTVFARTLAQPLLVAGALNREGAPAFAYGWRHLLAQLAVSGTFNDGFSDAVFEMVARFSRGESGAGFRSQEIAAIEI